MPTERGVSLTELGTIWLVRDFPPLFLFAQPDSWMAANWGRGSLAAAAESNALMPLTPFSLTCSLSLSLSVSLLRLLLFHLLLFKEKPGTYYQPTLNTDKLSTCWTRDMIAGSDLIANEVQYSCYFSWIPAVLGTALLRYFT